MGEVLERVVKTSGWKKGGARKNRGWGMALYDRGTPEGKASSALTLEADGRVNIFTGVPDVGPGYYTVSQQMVCETLGLPPEKVGVVFKDTDSLPFDPGTGGSKQTNTSGHAVNQLAHEVREKLINLAARELGCQRDEIRQAGGKLTAPNKKSTTTQRMIELAVKENGGPVFHFAYHDADSRASRTAAARMPPPSGDGARPLCSSLADDDFPFAVCFRDRHLEIALNGFLKELRNDVRALAVGQDDGEVVARCVHRAVAPLDPDLRFLSCPSDGRRSGPACIQTPSTSGRRAESTPPPAVNKQSR